MKKGSFLCVANWPSDVGYAWWLMESFWVLLANTYGEKCPVLLVYPIVKEVPGDVKSSNIVVEEYAFGPRSGSKWYNDLFYIRKRDIKYIYFSDRPLTSWRYLLYRLAGVDAIVVHDHTPGMRDKPKGLKKLLKRIRANLPYISCDVAIGASDFVRERCLNVACFPEWKCKSAPNGIREKEISKIKNKKILYNEFGIKEEDIVIVSVGRVTLYKGVGFTLNLVHKMVEDCGVVNLHYLHVGDGPDVSRFKELCSKLKIERHVTFAGKREDVHEILQTCDIAFHPSKGEVGYSLAILEYMMAGIPVVVPNNPSVCKATMHGKTGFVYHENDIESACKFLLRLANNSSLRTRMGQKARTIVLQDYSLDKCHKSLIEAIGPLVSI